METKRIEALADGVFAIAMTLLILEVKVPHVEGELSASALWHALGGVFPHVAAYVVSFVILGTLWIGHSAQFHYVRRVDRTLLWINVFFLLAIGFLPFATAFMADYYRSSVASVVYGGTLVASGVFLLAHWLHATRGRRLVASDLDERVVRAVKGRIAAGFVVYLAAIAVSFWTPAASFLLFAAMPIVYMFPGKVDRHLRG